MDGAGQHQGLDVTTNGNIILWRLRVGDVHGIPLNDRLFIEVDIALRGVSLGADAPLTSDVERRLVLPDGQLGAVGAPFLMLELEVRGGELTAEGIL
jgi:hypothetical protein